MHQEKKMETWSIQEEKLSNNQETTHEQEQEHVLLKIETFAHEEHEVFLKFSLEVLGHGENQDSSFLEYIKEKSKDHYLG